MFKWCALAVTAITVLSLMPQLRFWLVRGSQWKGAYTILQPDELLYSAYVNALIDGRPRRNDPATGQDHHPQAPLPESLFSIQFIPPVLIAWAARACGASASSSFIALLGAAGLLASLSLFWLLISMTNASKVSAVGVLVVLCYGTLAGGQGFIGLLLGFDVRFFGLPFLRRYEPCVPFPLFFVFCTLLCQALTSPFKRAATFKALLAGVTLGLLIFSYFYLWTAALAWLACVGCLWLLLRNVGRQQATHVLMVTIVPVILALALYAYLLSHLPPASDRAWIQTQTHRPDLLRIPEILGALILLALIIGVRQAKISRHEPQVIFTASFALLPFVVFNQHVITGRSIQPFHYEVLIANYVVLLGLVLLVRLFHPEIRRRTVFLIVFLCFFWATIEVNLPFHTRYALDVKNDEMVPLLLHLKEQAKYDGTWEGLRDHGKAPALVFSPLYAISGLLPTWAPQGSLLATGGDAFQSVSEGERKERLYTHYYYCGKSMEYMRAILNSRADDPFATYYAQSVLFGPERVRLFMDLNAQPIREDEIDQQVGAYDTFAGSFSKEKAGKRPLTYAVILADNDFDFSRIDLWYDRDAGEQVGAYILYRLRLRN